MDFYSNIDTSYQYHPYPGSVQYEDESWNYNQSFRGIPINRISTTTSPTLPPMQRFMQEPERPLFTTSPVDDDATMSPLPNLEPGPSTYMESHPYAHAFSQRYPSPANSGPSSSYVSSGWSDRQSTPWSSPGPSVIAHSPQVAWAEHLDFTYGGGHFPDDIKRSMSGPGVALHDVQNYADPQPEQFAFEDEQAAYYASSFPQEGYQPMEPDIEPSVNGFVNESGTSHGERQCSESPNLRRRRGQVTRAVTSPKLPSKVTKRPASRRRSSSSQSKTNGSQCNTYCLSSSNRAFPCPFAIYGCGSTFGSKNEWKRHVNTQHMRTRYWRCDQCDQGERKPNDFNRKDLFIQHVRRMHPLETEKASKTKTTGPRSGKNDPEERELASIANRCFRSIRSPPEASGCLFCDASFNGSGTWDERLEHIGKHMEGAKKEHDEPMDPKDWQDDPTLQQWLEREGIIAAAGKSWVLTEGRA